MVLYGNLGDFLALLATSGWEKLLDFENYFIKVGSYKKMRGLPTLYKTRFWFYDKAT